MSTAAVDEVTELVVRATALPADLGITLVRRVLETLEIPGVNQSKSVSQSKAISKLIGLAKGGNPPPDDDPVKRWIDEYRMEKYGK